ncbi:hypothetical protein BST61_g8621 [Cercospora zeina]
MSVVQLASVAPPREKTDIQTATSTVTTTANFTPAARARRNYRNTPALYASLTRVKSAVARSACSCLQRPPATKTITVTPAPTTSSVTATAFRTIMATVTVTVTTTATTTLTNTDTATVTTTATTTTTSQCPSASPSFCGNGCRNTFNDDSNCGSCGNSCTNGNACRNGSCIPTTCSPAQSSSCGSTCNCAISIVNGNHICFNAAFCVLPERGVTCNTDADCDDTGRGFYCVYNQGNFGSSCTSPTICVSSTGLCPNPSRKLRRYANIDLVATGQDTKDESYAHSIGIK